MLTIIACFVIIIVEILQFATVEANPTVEAKPKEVTISAYCTIEERYGRPQFPFPVYHHVWEHIKNCEQLGYVQQTEVKAVKDGIYYTFTFEPSQDFSAIDIAKENKCMDYQEEEDNELEGLLMKLQKAKKEMVESEKEYQKKLHDSESVELELPLRLKALLNAYDKGKKVSGSKAGGQTAFLNEYESNHKDFYDPLLEEKKPFEEKQRLYDIAKFILDAYINKTEEEKELVEFRKFYDENGKDEKLWELLKKYQETREATDECIKHCIQMSSIPEMGGFVKFTNEALKKNKKLCAIAKNELDMHIKKMEDDLAKPNHLVRLIRKVKETIQYFKEKWSHGPRNGKNSKDEKETGKEKKG